MPSTRLAFTILVITLLTIGIVNFLRMTQASFLSPSRLQTNPQAISGRWQHIQSSLGLEPLPSIIDVPFAIAPPRLPSRIDFGRRKREVSVPLHFAHDSASEPKLSLKELVISFRRISHQEAKAETIRSETKKGRSRLSRFSRSATRGRHMTATAQHSS